MRNTPFFVDRNRRRHPLNQKNMKTMLIGLAISIALITAGALLIARSNAATPTADKPIADKTSPESATPEQRVNAFIADYLRTHTKHPMSSTDFDAWEAAIRILNNAHFIGNAGMHMAQSQSSIPDHDPTIEKIIGTTVRSGATFVETKTVHMTMANYYEYEVRQVGNDWRIVRMDDFLYPESKPLVDEKDRVRLTESKAIALRQIPPQESFNGNQLLKTNRKVRLEGENKDSELQIRDVGSLNVRTGTLVVADFGYGASLFAPLAIRVAPGQYKVQVATAYGRNAALQVRFSDAAIKQWHPADVTSGGHVAGVDAGNMAVFDVAAVLDISARNHSRAFAGYTANGKRPYSGLMTVTNPNDVLIADSGFGDGRYPSYWGLDANGKPVVLVVDFFLSELEGI